MWDDCQLFLSKYKKKQRNPHPAQARVNYFLFPSLDLRIHRTFIYFGFRTEIFYSTYVILKFDIFVGNI